MMKKHFCWILIVLFLASVATAAETRKQSVPEQKKVPLSADHKKWLQDVYWIISDYERNAFESLKTDEDRDRFIKVFWENRDPTPGTARNEFEEEYFKRLEYVNRHYAESSLPGWKTDRGRVYLLLGKPQFIQRYPDPFELHPNELWTYVGLQNYGLPGSLNLIFFQDHGIPPYKLYSPLQDGVRSLFVIDRYKEEMSDQQLMQRLENQIDPVLANAAMSAIPTEGGGDELAPVDSGSLSTEMVLSKLQNARNYDIEKRRYVDDFMSDRPTVQVYYSIGGEGILDGVYWFQAPGGNYYIDYAIEYEPEKLELGQYDNYYTSLTLDGQIIDANKVEVDTIASSHEITLNEEQFKKIRFIPFQLQGRRPLVPGKFAINLIITNNVSRRGATFVHDIEIPDMSKAAAPVLSPVMPLRSVESAPPDDRKLRPFQFGDKLYVPNVPAKYALGSNMTVYNQVIFPEKFTTTGLTLHYKFLKGGSQEADITEPFNLAADKLAGNAVDIRKDLPLKDLSFGAQQLRLELWAGSKKIAEAAPMVFTIEAEVPQSLWRYSVAIPGYDSSYAASALAQQYLREGKATEAEALLEEAYRRDSGSLQLQLMLMRVALKAKNYDRVLALGSPMEIKDPRDKQLLWLMGWANYGKEKYEDAARFFERLRIEDPKRVEALNMLADIYYRLNQKDKGLERLNESLALKPDQKELGELKKKLESKN